jgi:hypothetical protein
LIRKFRFFRSKEANQKAVGTGSNVDNLNNVRREVRRHFRNKKKEYLKAEIEELESNSKIKNNRDLYRGINDLELI